MEKCYENSSRAQPLYRRSLIIVENWFFITRYNPFRTELCFFPQKKTERTSKWRIFSTDTVPIYRASLNSAKVQTVVHGSASTNTFKWSLCMIIWEFDFIWFLMFSNVDFRWWVLMLLSNDLHKINYKSPLETIMMIYDWFCKEDLSWFLMMMLYVD